MREMAFARLEYAPGSPKMLVARALVGPTIVLTPENVYAYASYAMTMKHP